MAVSADDARRELARRELARRRAASPPAQAPQATPGGWSAKAEADKIEKISGTGTFADMTGSGMAKGIPFADEIYSILSAVPNAAISLAKGDGFSPSREYDRSMQLQEELQKRRDNRSPVASTTGAILSGIGAAGPLVKGGATLLQGAKATLPSLMSRGAAEGSLYGVAYGAGEGRGLDERALNALYGAGFGAATGAAGGAIARVGAGKATSREMREAAELLGVKPKDVKLFAERMKADNLSPADFNARMTELGPQALPMDVGPNLRQEAQRIVAAGGEGRTTISNILNARDQGANARIRGSVDSELGPAPLPSQIDADIVANQRVVSPQYGESFRDARRVDTTQIAERLESAAVRLRGDAQKAVRDVRRMLDVPGTDQLDPNPATLFETRQAIDGLMATTTNPKAVGELAQARQEIDSILAGSVPRIKEVDAKFAELARQREALSRGQQVLDGGRTAPRPQELADEVLQGALPGGMSVGPSAIPVRLRQGARAEIERIIGTNANDLVALQRLIKGEGDWNRARLATLFGRERADRIIRVLDQERAFAETSNRVIKNSATAERLPQGGVPGMDTVSAYKAGGTMGALRSLGVNTLEAIAGKITKASGETRNSNMAKLLTETDMSKLAAALPGRQSAEALSDFRKLIVDLLIRSNAVAGPKSIATGVRTPQR